MEKDLKPSQANPILNRTKFNRQYKRKFHQIDGFKDGLRRDEEKENIYEQGNYNFFQYGHIYGGGKSKVKIYRNKIAFEGKNKQKLPHLDTDGKLRWSNKKKELFPDLEEEKKDKRTNSLVNRIRKFKEVDKIEEIAEDIDSIRHRKKREKYFVPRNFPSLNFFEKKKNYAKEPKMQEIYDKWGSLLLEKCVDPMMSKKLMHKYNLIESKRKRSPSYFIFYHHFLFPCSGKDKICHWSEEKKAYLISKFLQKLEIEVLTAIEILEKEYEKKFGKKFVEPRFAAKEYLLKKDEESLMKAALVKLYFFRDYKRFKLFKRFRKTPVRLFYSKLGQPEELLWLKFNPWSHKHNLCEIDFFRNYPVHLARLIGKKCEKGLSCEAVFALLSKYIKKFEKIEERRQMIIDGAAVPDRAYFQLWHEVYPVFKEDGIQNDIDCKPGVWKDEKRMTQYLKLLKQDNNAESDTLQVFPNKNFFSKLR